MVLGGVYYGQTYMNRLGLGENGKGGAASMDREEARTSSSRDRGGGEIENELVGELLAPRGLPDISRCSRCRHT